MKEGVEEGDLFFSPLKEQGRRERKSSRNYLEGTKADSEKCKLKEVKCSFKEMGHFGRSCSVMAVELWNTKRFSQIMTQFLPFLSNDFGCNC